jgi:addiction module RelE/StbE family toxin
MAYAVVYTDPALLDLENIEAYLGQFYSGTPQKFADALRTQVKAIKNMPYMYPVYQGNPAYRKMLVTNYVVFYKVQDAEQTIEIHRILHGSQDMAQHLP